jgi:hypothetical protein
MSYFSNLSLDLAALGSQFGEAIAKAGADIEQVADNALGTSKKQGGAISLACSL